MHRQGGELLQRPLGCVPGCSGVQKAACRRITQPPQPQPTRTRPSSTTRALDHEAAHTCRDEEMVAMGTHISVCSVELTRSASARWRAPSSPTWLPCRLQWRAEGSGQEEHTATTTPAHTHPPLVNTRALEHKTAHTHTHAQKKGKPGSLKGLSLRPQRLKTDAKTAQRWYFSGTSAVRGFLDPFLEP